MKFGVVLVCAGRGKRLKKRTDKAFVKIEGIPLFYYSYKVFKETEGISRIVCVTRREYFPFIRSYVKDKSLKLTAGGLRRQDSVYQGLLSLDSDIDYVIIHDAARPFIGCRMIRKIKKEVIKHKAVSLALKVKDAVKKGKKGFIEKTVERKELYSIQTPQAFSKELLLAAYRRFRKVPVYDDAEMIELMGRKVKIIEGAFLNIKITYPDDLILAKKILGLSKQ
ncbi:MAG: 2-C-methyl-D-erythritol 4-phosphate cytidylyltransferase [Candidatus Omnitrophota bacterium]